MIKRFFTAISLFLIIMGVYFVINSVFALSVGLIDVIFGDLKNNIVGYFAYAIYPFLVYLLVMILNIYSVFANHLFTVPVHLIEEFVTGEENKILTSFRKRDLRNEYWKWSGYISYPLMANTIIMFGGRMHLDFKFPDIILVSLFCLVPLIMFISILLRESLKEITGVIIHASSIGWYFLFGTLFFNEVNRDPIATWSLFLVFFIVGCILVSIGIGLYKLISATSSNKITSSRSLVVSNPQCTEMQRMAEKFNNQIIQMQDDIKKDFNDKMTGIIDKLKDVIVVTRLEELRVNTLRDISFAEQQTVKIMLEELLSVQRDLEFMKHLSFEEKKQRFELAQNRVISALQILR